VPVLAKLLGLLAMPTGLLWLALIGLAVWFRRERAGRALLGVLLAYTLAGNVWVGGALMQSLEAGVRSVHPEEVPPLDALFVLGGGTKLGPRDYPEAGTHGDRVVLAARLYHAGKVALLVTSGRSTPGIGEDRDITLSHLRIWTELGVPESAVLRLSAPHNTSMELAEYAALARDHRFERVGILSSAFHLPRVMANAERQGLAAIPIAADHRGGHGGLALPNLVPQADGFARVGLACWELLGRAVGR